MSSWKKIGFGLVTVSIFIVGYAIAATITSTQVNSGIRVTTQSSLSLQDAQGTVISSLDFGSAAPGGTSTISQTRLVYSSNDPAARYVVVSTVGLPAGFLFASPQQGATITPEAPLSMSFTVTVAPAAPPQQFSWTVAISISDTPP